MSDLIEIPKANLEIEVRDYPYVDIYPSWMFVRDTEGRTVRPMIVCNCGTPLNCSAHHIHKDGEVTASFYHRKDERDPKGCGWHVFLKLKDWVGLEFLPNKDLPE